MKNVFETVAKWFSSPHSGNAQDAEAAALPEHERRLQELEKSGRKLFLP
jgi:hypothetical protein